VALQNGMLRKKSMQAVAYFAVVAAAVLCVTLHCITECWKPAVIAVHIHTTVYFDGIVGN